MHEKAIFTSDLLKAREIMGEDRPWELSRLGREVRGLNEGKWRRRAPNVVYKLIGHNYDAIGKPLEVRQLSFWLSKRIRS